MKNINWGRVVLGGMLAGVVLLTLVSVSAMLAGQHGLQSAFSHKSAGPLFVVFVFLFVGILMTSWYAAIRPRFGPGPKTAAIAGLAVWLIALSEILKSIALNEPVSSLPSGPLLPIISLLMIVASTEVGAWVYKE